MFGECRCCRGRTVKLWNSSVKPDQIVRTEQEDLEKNYIKLGHNNHRKQYWQNDVVMDVYGIEDIRLRIKDDHRNKIDIYTLFLCCFVDQFMANEKLLYLIYGFGRKNEQLLNKVIPKGIQMICYKYYGSPSIHVNNICERILSRPDIMID